MIIFTFKHREHLAIVFVSTSANWLHRQNSLGQAQNDSGNLIPGQIIQNQIHGRNNELLHELGNFRGVVIDHDIEILHDQIVDELRVQTTVHKARGLGLSLLQFPVNLPALGVHTTGGRLWANNETAVSSEIDQLQTEGTVTPQGEIGTK